MESPGERELPNVTRLANSISPVDSDIIVLYSSMDVLQICGGRVKAESKSRDRTPPLSRTRNTILDAAATVLSANPAATIADISDSVGMARSTVYRHFVDRSSLKAAMKDYAESRLADIGQELATRSGTARELLLILCHTYFHEADLLMSAFGDRSQSEEMEAVGQESYLAVLITQGHQDGSIDVILPAAWVEQTLWSLLYNAWLLSRSKVLTPHEALSLFLRSFEKVLS